MSVVSWWFRSAECTLTEEISAPSDQVRAFYVDLDNIRLVHPLVVAVRSIGRTETDDGYVQTYRIDDRIPLGRLTLPTRYTVWLNVPVAGDVIAEARQFPSVRLNSVVRFDEVSSGTRLTERMWIHAPRILTAVTIREAVQAHTAMLFNIRRHFT